jgi:hypothetical protein
MAVAQLSDTFTATVVVIVVVIVALAGAGGGFAAWLAAQKDRDPLG